MFFTGRLLMGLLLAPTSGEPDGGVPASGGNNGGAHQNVPSFSPAEAARLQMMENQLRQLQADNQRLADAAEAAERTRREQELSQRPIEEQLRAYREQTQANLDRQAAEWNAALSAMQAQSRAAELMAYREYAMRSAGPEIIPEMVGGNSEQEIDISVNAAKQKFQELKQQFQGRSPIIFPVPATQAPTQSPYFVPPVGVGYAGQQQPQFMRAPNPGQVGVMDEGQGLDVAALTTEEAVRSGRYSKEVRQKLHESLRNIGAGQALGVQPRYMVTAPPGYTALPGGVMQPQGHPTPVAVNPQYAQYVQQPPVGYPQNPNQFPPVQQPMMPQGYPVQNPYGQPVYQQPVYQPGLGIPGLPMTPQGYPVQQQMAIPQSQPMSNDFYAQAQAAVQRTHNGQNPLLNDPGNQGASEGLSQAQQYARANGVNPQAVYGQRFAHTPPHPTN